ncbi:MAG: hypothetical protein RR929_00830 [Erysipelotrichaceae bacterium]
MNKKEFNQLSIEHQVDYINSQLGEISLTKICEVLDINRSTIRKRFIKYNYKLIDNQYIIITDATTVTTDVKITNNKLLVDRIDTLERELSNIKAMLENSNTTKVTTDVTTTDFKGYTNDAVARNYRVDADIQQQFKEYCKQHSTHRVSDLLSQAIEEFINIHK